MLEYISGKVEELTPASVVIACNGIGYWVNISLNTYSALSLGKEVKIYIYEAIREDAFVLYGFSEKKLLDEVPAVAMCSNTEEIYEYIKSAK